MEDRTKGVFFILMSAFFFALMAALVKSLAEIPVTEKIFFRNLLGLAVALYMIKRRGVPTWGNNKKGLLLRSFFGLLGVVTYFSALSMDIALADAVILNKTSPFFVMILSALFLGEKIKKPQFIALFLAIVGAAFVVKPQFDSTVFPALIALGSAFFAGSAYTTIRHLRHTDAPETIVFYFAFCSTLAMLPFMLFGQFIVPTPNEILRLLGLGICATIAQFFMTHAYRYAPAGELSIYTYANIIFSTVIGLVIWAEMPDGLSIVGGMAIIVAGLINYYSNKTSRKKMRMIK